MLDAFNVQSVIYGCRIAQVINKPVYACEHIAPVTCTNGDVCGKTTRILQGFGSYRYDLLNKYVTTSPVLEWKTNKEAGLQVIETRNSLYLFKYVEK